MQNYITMRKCPVTISRQTLPILRNLPIDMIHCTLNALSLYLFNGKNDEQDSESKERQ